MPDEDKTEDEFVQFVCFKSAGHVPVDLFQQSWISAAEDLFARGISKVIFSEKLALNGDLSPYKFISKNCWASLKAVKGTFANGLPSPCSRGHVTVSQVLLLHNYFPVEKLTIIIIIIINFNKVSNHVAWENPY